LEEIRKRFIYVKVPNQMGLSIAAMDASLHQVEVMIIVNRSNL
jgi:hypothetical protein